MRYINNISVFQAWMLVSIMAASCSTDIIKEGAEYKKPISFESPTAKDTRAAIIGTTFPKESFRVWGGKVADSEFLSNPIDAYNNIFNGTEIKYSDARGWYYDGELKLWEENTIYNFYGVYPVTAGRQTITDDEGVICIAVYDFEASATGDDAVDFMTAAYQESRAISVSDRTAIKFNFKHRLAKVNFIVKNEVLSKYTIKAVGLDGIAYKGDFYSESMGGNWRELQKSTSRLMSAGAESNNPETFTKEFQTGISPGENGETSLFGDLLVMPYNYSGTTNAQNGTEVINSATLIIQYSPQNNQTIESKDLTIDENWEMGHSYRYVLGLGESGNNIVISSFEILDWDEKTETEINW